MNDDEPKPPEMPKPTICLDQNWLAQKAREDCPHTMSVAGGDPLLDGQPCAECGWAVPSMGENRL